MLTHQKRPYSDISVRSKLFNFNFLGLDFERDKKIPSTFHAAQQKLFQNEPGGLRRRHHKENRYRRKVSSSNGPTVGICRIPSDPPLEIVGF